MTIRGRLIRLGVALSVVCGSLVPGISPVSAHETLVVGVDNAGPANHNFEFTDYYPRSGVRVHNHAVVGFRFNTASLDGFHTATLGKLGNDARATFGDFPQVLPDFDDPFSQQGPQLQFSNDVLLPTGSGSCGSQSNPCSYDGTTDTNSGALCNGLCASTQFFVRINLPQSPTKPVTVSYVCLIHGPAMSGSITVLQRSDRSVTDQEDLNDAAAAQFAGQTSAGLAAEAAANTAAVTSSNGIKTIHLTAGTETPDQHVQVLEMLPTNVSIENEARTVVTWTPLSFSEIHTVTFPAGHGSDSVDPLPNVCEGTPDTPTTIIGGCSPASAYELHVIPQPQGPTQIDSPSTVASSGVIAPFPPFIPSATFTFTNEGSFTYQCRIHDNMRGTITVGESEESRQATG